jgi:hypothetical protein
MRQTIPVLSIIFATVLVQQASPKWVQHPFNGKDLTGWSAKAEGAPSAWAVGTAQIDPKSENRLVAIPGGKDLVNASPNWGQSRDFYTSATWGDVHLSLEVMVPKGSNSGIYLMGEYEVQVLDSSGNDANPQSSDMGAIYGAQPPHHPKYRAPGVWNTYDIWFRAPKFDAAGKRIAKATFVKIVLNGVTIHENVQMDGPTPGGVDGQEKPVGPVMFQGNHGSVAYRNIRVRKF